ncbi:MAG: PIN domain-containing protein [Thermoplasmata archaeon]
MKDEPFFDTNILFYAYDLSEPIKRKFCKQIVEDVFSGRKSGVISNQILVELYNALTRKLAVHRDSAIVIVESFIESENWLKINYNEHTVMSALKSSLAFMSPFLDTLIAETMKDHGINRIITENEKDFERIPGLKIINPIVQKV